MSTPGGSDGQSLAIVPDEVRAVGRYVYGIADALRTALDSASREVEALLGDGWTGDLAAEFGTGWSETNSGGNQIFLALTEMAEKLGVTADTYQKQDTTNSYAINMAGLDLPEL
ncbi:WXG100 family type VII secretion target [Nocardia asteroides]|uniref:WXG100 family type VII secretion target n=1 Tax=Nocardia asteroides TaxID=1824 RepID=UPI001E50BFAA|nr:WXG100 family type VII secretion target [Nocardia asteroides]UGT53127.1 WXG100 family type VII secretion target [Nocardia asteroides]